MADARFAISAESAEALANLAAATASGGTITGMTQVNNIVFTIGGASGSTFNLGWTPLRTDQRRHGRQVCPAGRR